VRYEKTDVVSTALVPAAVDIKWVSQNEFPITFGDPTFTTLTGKYNNLLPSFDSDIELTPDQKLRFSYGETIGRPRYDQIQGGTTLNSLVRTNGGTGSQGNPSLKPVKSKTSTCPTSGTTASRTSCRWACSRKTSRTTPASRASSPPRSTCTRRWAARCGTRRWARLRQHRHHLYP
jgi:hypothetical protein